MRLHPKSVAISVYYFNTTACWKDQLRQTGRGMSSPPAFFGTTYIDIVVEELDLGIVFSMKHFVHITWRLLVEAIIGPQWIGRWAGSIRHGTATR